MLKAPALHALESSPTVWAVLYILLSPFGLSLQPLSPLTAFQLLSLYQTLLLSYCTAKTAAQRVARVAVCIFLGSTGWSIGNAGLFSFQGFNIINLPSVWILATVAWTAIILLGVLPAVACRAKYQYAPSQAIALPACLAAVFYLIGLTPLGTFANPGYMLLDVKPFALAAAYIGIHGLNFLLACMVSAAALAIDPQWPGVNRAYKKFSVGLAAVLLVVLVAGSVLEYHDVYYQRSVRALDTRLIQGSCIFRNGEQNYEQGAASLLEKTASRIRAADDIILWSEVAVMVTLAEEAKLIKHAKALLANASPSTLLGITYALNQSTTGNQSAATSSWFVKNMYVLLSRGKEHWRYQKAHPVPVAEAGVQAGPAILPVTQTAFGTVAGATCFDMDSTSFMSQASRNKVDLLLQPSNTWGPIGQLHFRDNALRAVENGFVLFRCSANGFSGVVSPYFDFVHHLPTFESETRTFSIPLYGHRATVYSYVGGVLEGLLVVVALAFWVLALLPSAWQGVVRRAAPPGVVHYLLGYTDEELQALAASEDGEPLLNGRVDADDV